MAVQQQLVPPAQAQLYMGGAGAGAAPGQPPLAHHASAPHQQLQQQLDQQQQLEQRQLSSGHQLTATAATGTAFGCPQRGTASPSVESLPQQAHMPPPQPAPSGRPLPALLRELGLDSEQQQQQEQHQLLQDPPTAEVGAGGSAADGALLVAALGGAELEELDLESLLASDFFMD